MTEEGELCDCQVCRNARHRAAVWARHLAGKDYPGIHAKMREPTDPNWKRLQASDPTNAGGER